MKCIFIVCVILALNQLCRAEERSAKPFKDCFFIGNNLSSVHILFENFNETYTRDNCFELINDEQIAKNVTFLKVSGFKLNKAISYYARFGESEVKELANKFNEVRALDISNNAFRSLRPIISNFKNLQFLNASRNDIGWYFESKFNEMSQLSEIDLSSNHIQHVLDVPLTNLPELKVIDVRNNRLNFIWTSFDGNRKLETLRLSDNAINIDCNIWKLLARSVSIEMSWERVSYLKTDCKEIKLKVSVENGNVIIRSSVNRKELMRINGNHFGKLRTVYFGPDQISNTSEILDLLGSSIEDLNLNGNSVGKLNAHTFQRFTQLRYLELDRTDLLEFDCNPFKSLRKLTTLSLSHNHLNKLNFTLLHNTLRHLEWFYFAGNHLENGYELIEHLGPHLAYLDLSQNFVGKIKSSTFQHFKKLWSLNLSQTNLSSFDCDPHENSIQLNGSNELHSRCTNFNMHILLPLERLSELDISHNGLTSVDFSAQYPFESLGTLRVNSNQLTELNGLDQDTYPDLEYLNIEENPISSEHISSVKWRGLKIN